MNVILTEGIPDGTRIVFPQSMSDEAFDAFCAQNPDLFLERDRHGNILVEPPVHYDSGRYESDAHGELYAWNRRTRLGKVFSPSTGFDLPNGAIRSPDASWIANERIALLPASERKRFARICPDFVIEIRSRSDRMRALHEKMEEYIECGAQLGFLIDPLDRQAFVYRPGTVVRHLDGLDGVLSGEPVLTGFSLDLSLFLGDG